MSARINNTFLLSAFSLLSFLTFSSSAFGAPVCGPGDHWIDSCSVAGGPSADPDFYTDTFDSVATVSIDLDFDDTADITVVLGGLVEIFRSDPIEGDPTNDPGHLNHIDTELVEMTLVSASGDITLRAGDGTANLQSDGLLYSGGTIDEQAGDPSLADSFFDVFVEIDILGLGTLHNNEAFIIGAVIDRVPPLGFNYVHPFSALPVELFDASGALVAQIVQANHKPIPEPSTYLLFSAGLGLLAMRRRKIHLNNKI